LEKRMAWAEGQQEIGGDPRVQFQEVGRSVNISGSGYRIAFRMLAKGEGRERA